MTGKRSINSPNAPLAEGSYSQALEVSNTTRRLYISGQIPVGLDGTVPGDFRGQAQRVWQNIIAQLHAADMGIEDLVKVTTFLSDRKYADDNGDIRRQFLGDQKPALTVIIAGIFDPEWLLEIEAIAEK